MPIRDCRKRKNGSDRKQEILDRYDLVVGPRCKLLRHQELEAAIDGEEEAYPADGQGRQGCCGPLKDQFFQFFYKPKPNFKGDTEYPAEAGSFYVGRKCAEVFLERMGEALPELFDPLRHRKASRVVSDEDEGKGKERGDDGGPQPPRPPQPPLTPLNQEVLTVLQLLATLCRRPLRNDLNRVLCWLRENPDRDTQAWSVFKVNDAVGQHPELGRRQRTLRQAIEAERQLTAEGEWREFQFPEIERLLRMEGRRSWIDPGLNLEMEACCGDRVELREYVGDRGFWRGYILGTSTPVFLFPNGCEGIEGFPDLAVGDVFRVRIAIAGKFRHVVRLIVREERPQVGMMAYVDPAGA